MDITDLIAKFRPFEKEVSLDYLKAFGEGTVEYYLWKALTKRDFGSDHDIVAILGPEFSTEENCVRYISIRPEQLEQCVGIYFYRIERAEPRRVFKNMLNDSDTRFPVQTA